MIRRLLLIALAIVAAVPAADLGPGPVPTNTTLLTPGPIGSTTPSTGAFTTLSATGNLSVINSSGATTTTVTLHDNATTGNARLRLFGGSGHYNYQFGANENINQALDLTPSTATGGTTFSTPAISMFGANGDIVINGTTDNATDKLQIAGNVCLTAAGNGFKVKEGTNARMGTATLVAGVSTVSNTSVTASTRIFLESNADGGTPGWLRVSARVASTSFTITSSSGTDTSTVAWVLVEPSP